MKILLITIILYATLFANKIIVGKNEKISFPKFELYDLRAKIDTGAKTSSLHCSMIKQIDENRVIFTLLDENHKKFKQTTYTANISRIADVKSSNGKKQQRIFIKIPVKFGQKEYISEFSLSDRGSMKFPVLVGRSLLEEGFVVDVAYEYLLNKKQ